MRLRIWVVLLVFCLFINWWVLSSFVCWYGIVVCKWVFYFCVLGVYGLCWFLWFKFCLYVFIELFWDEMLCYWWIVLKDWFVSWWVGWVMLKSLIWEGFWMELYFRKGYGLMYCFNYYLWLIRIWDFGKYCGLLWYRLVEWVCKLYLYVW